MKNLLKTSTISLVILTLGTAQGATIQVYSEDFNDGASDFGFPVSSVVNGQFELDLETRGNGTNFNNISPVTIDLTSLNIDLSTVSEVGLSFDFNTAGSNTAADTAAGFGGDSLGSILEAVDAGGNALGRYPAGGEFLPRVGLSSASSYNTTFSGSQVGDLLTLFPTATQLRLSFFAREAGDGMGGGSPVGVAGNDFALDNVIVTVEADLVPEPHTALMLVMGLFGLLKRRR